MTVIPDSPNRARVLVVDDDASLLRVLARGLASSELEVVTAETGAEALARLAAGDIHVLVCDIGLPDIDGVELCNQVRRRDPDLPIVVLTGAPSIDTAMRAMELTVFRYLSKPVPNAVMLAVVTEAVRMRRLAQTRAPAAERDALANRTVLIGAFGRAIETLYMAYQPIVASTTRQTIGHEALMRTKEPALPHPGAVLEAAEKLGSLHLLGRTTRARVADTLSGRPDGGTIFVNLHSADLADPDLYAPDAPLARFANRIVLEITERASLEGVPDVAARMKTLRGIGYRIAIDDLGAGYAGLNYFASLRPDIVKIDMSLTRNVDSDPVRTSVVRSLVKLSLELGMLVVAEGVETAAERDVLVSIGCTCLQGYLLARPGGPFPEVTWT